MTWLELIKLKLSEEKAKGKAPSIGDVTPLAKKEWVQIKEGKHPLYVQGKAQTFARKKKGSAASKTKKNSKRGSGNNTADSSMSVQQVLAEAKVCNKCKKKVEKVMKKKGGMKGGRQCMSPPLSAQNGGDCPCGGLTGGCADCASV